MATLSNKTSAETTHLPPLIRALLTDHACYDHVVDNIQLVETHISWVLLTGMYAYKIKKPIDLGFLNFSTIALRQQACADEVRLNQRLASDYYLGVIAITGSPNSPLISDPNQVTQHKIIEYAVKMRQFPLDATLDRLDEQDRLGTVQIDALAIRLAKFHLHECETASRGDTWGNPESIAQPVMENFRLLADRCFDPDTIHRLAAIRNWSTAEHSRLAPLMHKRKRDGMVRECHGDLHLGNLAWVNEQIVIFDCIEFNAALRWIDVVSEVAFCFMDLLHRQHGDLAMHFLNSWLEITGDYAGVALLRYYAVYRAMVRTKVAALRAEQSGNIDTLHSEFDTCLLLAEQLTQEIPTQLWITHGFSGSGKTTLSQAVSQKYGMIRLRSDIERKRLAGLCVMAQNKNKVGQGLYTKEASKSTYEHLLHLAEEILNTGWPVIVDAAFLERWKRDLFRSIAKRHRVAFKILYAEVEYNTLRKRISIRAAKGNDASDANIQVLQHQIETSQPLGCDELDEVINM